ncbi:MAG: Fe-S-cluster containining protein [Francisellaceae bacterium]|jgi:Fe-S-cluster containining protein
MECRIGCGACCTAISITSPIPGMPTGKPSGVRCVNLDNKNLCQLFGQPSRPKVCSDFQASKDFCGDSAAEAIILISEIEHITKP